MTYRLVGVLGGTFDPIHFGHLRPALDLLDDLGLSELRLIPSHTPPHRNIPAANAQQRLEMVALAIANEPRLSLDDREISRQGASYMVDTLASLAAEQNENTAQVLIMGVDVFLGLPQWHRWQQILEWAHIIITHRPGWQPPSDGICGDLLKDRSVDSVAQLSRAKAGRILVHRVTQLEISASKIRQQIKQGYSPRFMLPDTVLDYIGRKGLYR